MSNKDYQVKYFSIENIKDSPSQADSRTEPGKLMTDLIKSIKEHGQFYPGLGIALNEDEDQLMDGHRRKAALKALGFKKMPIILVDNDTKEINTAAVFAEIAKNQKKTSALELMETYLKGGFILPSPTKSCIKNLCDTMGNDFVVKLVAASKSPAIWNDAIRVIKCGGLNRDTDIKPVLEWLFTVGPSKVKAFMQANGPAEELVKAYKENRVPKF